MYGPSALIMPPGPGYARTDPHHHCQCADIHPAHTGYPWYTRIANYLIRGIPDRRPCALVSPIEAHHSSFSHRELATILIINTIRRVAPVSHLEPPKKLPRYPSACATCFFHLNGRASSSCIKNRSYQSSTNGGTFARSPIGGTVTVGNTCCS